jgi:protein O-GlcNAc transferase
LSVDGYEEWLARGRAHQRASRPIDALICFRRALREQASGVDARLHLAEIAWDLGQHADAISAWLANIEAAPSHVASWQALANAWSAIGQLHDAQRAIARVLDIEPRNGHAKALATLLAAAVGTASDTEIAEAVQSNEGWPLPVLSAIVMRMLSSRASSELTGAARAVLDAAAATVVSATREADALRLIALALGNAGFRQEAQSFADSYARNCRALRLPSPPMSWPIRSAGEAARIGLLVAPDNLDEAVAVIRASEDAGMSDLAWTLLGTSSARRETTHGHVLRALPEEPGAASRAVAMLDLDLLIDLAGVRVAWGPLLALRPARELWAVAEDPMPHIGELADRVLALDAPHRFSQLTKSLEAFRDKVAAESTSASDRDALAAIWERAVRTHESGDHVRARSGYASILQEQPGYAPALYLLGNVALAERNASEAVARFTAAIDAAPAFVDARVALATLHLENGKPPEAAAVAREGLRLLPSSARLWRLMAHAALKQGNADAAVVAFEEALKGNVADGETHYNQGVALQTAGKLADAARVYERALALRPDLIAAGFNLGVIHSERGDDAAAATVFSKVLQRAPDHAGAYKALAETLRASGRIEAWFANFDQFEQHCPGHFTLAVHALEICAYRGDFGRLAHYLDRVRRERLITEGPAEMVDAVQELLYLLHFFDVEPDLFGHYARLHDGLARNLYGAPWLRRAERRQGQLRLGYISGDFRNHVMGKMIWEALRRHDRSRFEVNGYATTGAHDQWTARFESAFSRFHSLAGLSDRAAAQRIAADDLDVLVDLSTHTKGARPGILALKPARVQITHVASAGTLAMSAIDFKLTDAYADIADDSSQRIEPLLAMQGCVYPYRHIAPSATSSLMRDAAKIPSGSIVIGAFCAPLKLSQRCLALWREVLARVPHAVLAFSPLHPALRDVYQRLAAVAGIGPDRVAFVPQGRDDAENQARYRLIDFVLDPLPYGGANGTLEALDMGVPVVTLVGKRHAERTAFSILTNLGVTETIAQTPAEYVAVAVRLATEQSFMRAVRERIVAGLARSTLTDMAAHTRHLEAAYVKALELRAPESLVGARTGKMGSEL